MPSQWNKRCHTVPKWSHRNRRWSAVLEEPQPPIQDMSSWWMILLRKRLFLVGNRLRKSLQTKIETFITLIVKSNISKPIFFLRDIKTNLMFLKYSNCIISCVLFRKSTKITLKTKTYCFMTLFKFIGTKLFEQKWPNFLCVNSSIFRVRGPW